jgi:peptide/nickel transport system permease protein
VSEGVSTARGAGPYRRWLRSSATGNVLRGVLADRKALIGAVLFLFFVVLAVFAGQIAPYSPSSETFPSGAPPSFAHILGTTTYGQDIFSQLVWATRESLVIALAAGLIATGLSVIVGVTAALMGGWGDAGLSLIIDTFLVIPAFPLVIVIATYEKSGGNLVLIIVLVLTGWAFGARQLRSQALSLRNRDFLLAASIRGERKFRIVIFEMLPSMTSLIVAAFLSTALYAVLAAAGLQFIGLGNPNSQSWGTMLYWAQNNEAIQITPLWEIAPGVCVALLGAAFGLLNYAFDEASNPALRGSRKRRGD